MCDDERAVRGGIKYIEMSDNCKENSNENDNNMNNKNNSEKNDIVCYLSNTKASRRTKGLLLMRDDSRIDNNGLSIANSKELTPLHLLWHVDNRGKSLCFSKIMSNFDPEPMLLDISPIKQSLNNNNNNSLTCKLFDLFDESYCVGKALMKSAEIGFIELEVLRRDNTKRFIMVDGCWSMYESEKNENNERNTNDNNDTLNVPNYWIDFMLERTNVPKRVYNNSDISYEQKMIDFVLSHQKK